MVSRFLLIQTFLKHFNRIFLPAKCTVTELHSNRLRIILWRLNSIIKMQKVKAAKNVAVHHRCNYNAYGISHRSFSAKIRQKIIQQRVQRFRQLVLAKQKRTKENAKRRRLNKATQAPDPSGKIFIPVATGYEFYQRNKANQHKKSQQQGKNPEYRLTISGEKSVNLSRAKQQTKKGERCIRLGTTNGDSADIADICRVVGSHQGESRERYSKKIKYVSLVYLRVFAQNISPISLRPKSGTIVIDNFFPIKTGIKNVQGSQKCKNYPYKLNFLFRCH